MSVVVSAQRTSANYSASVPQATLIQIMRAEDERRWDENLKSLLSSNDAAIRKRAVLAAGRIGAEAAVPVLAEMLLTDREPEVREMAAFALGEIESGGGAYALVTVLNDPNRPGRARAVVSSTTRASASHASAAFDAVRARAPRRRCCRMLPRARARHPRA